MNRQKTVQIAALIDEVNRRNLTGDHVPPGQAPGVVFTRDSDGKIIPELNAFPDDTRKVFYKHRSLMQTRQKKVA